MSHVFWIDHAWDAAVGPAWPRLESMEVDRARILPVLLNYWDERAARCDAATLSPATRSALRDRMDDPGRALRAGYEYVRRASELDPLAFWSLDLSSAAWGIAVTRAWTRSGETSEAVREYMTTWRHKGLAALKGELPDLPVGVDAGWELLLRGLVRVYVDRDAAGAIDDLDRGLTRLPPAARAELGISVPLTYALLVAFTEGPGTALRAIEEEIASEDWTSDERAELSYHRLRLLRTGAGEVSPKDIVAQAQIDPSSLIRMATDRAFGDGHLVRTATAPESESIRSEMIRWQRRMPEPEGADPFADVRFLLRTGSDTYSLFAAQGARRRAIEAGAEEPYFAPPGFALQMREINGYVHSGPPGLPLCLGRGSPPFCGQEGSLWGEIEARSVDALTPAIVSDVEQIHNLLPEGVRIALQEHASRLFEALKAAYDVASADPKKEDYARRLGSWGSDLMRAYDEIGRLPDYTSEALGRAASSIWDAFAGIETAWSQYLRREVGHIVVSAEGTIEIPVGGWRAITCRVSDVGGSPIPAAPIVWWIEDGPAEVREAAQCLYDSWAHSLKTGLAYLALSVPAAARPGDEGVIAIRPAGPHEPTKVRYTIV